VRDEAGVDAGEVAEERAPFPDASDEVEVGRADGRV
jgi:hypothetical protein